MIDSRRVKLVWVTDGERVRGRIAFFNERVDLEVDGVAQERPSTQWSG